RHQGPLAHAVALDVLLDPGYGQRAGGFGDGAGVVVDVLDRRADFIGADGDHLIHILLADVEGVLADLRHGDAVGEQPDLPQHHALAGGHGGLQAIGIVRLDADHLYFRAQVFDEGGDARHQAATAHWDEDGIKAARMLAEDFHRHGALSGNHVRVV